MVNNDVFSSKIEKYSAKWREASVVRFPDLKLTKGEMKVAIHIILRDEEM